MDGINPQNAFQQGLQAWQVGANIGQQQQAHQMAEQQQQRAQQYKDMLTKVISNPASTAQDYLMLQAQFPEQAKAIKDLEAQQSEAENQSDTRLKMQLLNAASAKNWDTFKNFGQEQVDAYKNSGRDMKAQGLQSIIDMIGTVPDEVIKGSLLNSLAATMKPEDFKKIVESQASIGGEKRAEQLSPGEIRKQELENKKLDLELKKMQGQAETPSEEVFNQEAKIRAEYDKKAQNYSEAYDSYERLRLGAEADTGQGDLALITGFMKMLDPGSVVRETEFANAQDTSGIWNRVKSMVSKWKEGERLQPEDRKKFLDLSRKYMQAAIDKDTQVRKGYSKLIQDYNLDENRIFGEQFNVNEPGAAKKETTETQPQVFNSMAEAEKASMTLPKGTEIQVGNKIFRVK